MGGSVKKGYAIIGGVVREDIKEYYDQLVREKKFESRSKAVGYVLTEYVEKDRIKQFKTEIEKIFRNRTIEQ